MKTITQQRWADYYAKNKEALKAKRLAKRALMSPEQIEAKRIAKAAYNTNYYLENRDRIFTRLEERTEERRAVGAAYRKNNYDKERARHIRYYTENKEEVWRKELERRNANPMARQLVLARYDSRNLARRCANQNRRRARQLQATPLWANDEAILALYTESKALKDSTGLEHHVDHIVPLISGLVCGLHCEFNLRVTLGKENLSKGNRYWPGMP